MPDDSSVQTEAYYGVLCLSRELRSLIQARIQPEPRFALEIFKENGAVCVDLRVFDGSAYPCYYTADGVNDSSIQSAVNMGVCSD